MVAGETALARRRRGKMEAGISQAEGRRPDSILERPSVEGTEGDGTQAVPHLSGKQDRRRGTFLSFWYFRPLH